MKQLLLRVTLYVFLAQLGAPGGAVGQYLFHDTDGDGDCDYDDSIVAPLDTITVWLDTNHTLDGAVTTCLTGAEELSISGYEVLLHGSTRHGGSIVFGAWTNLVPQFTVDLGTVQGGADIRVSYTSPGAATFLPPGRYRLGMLPIQTTGGICDHLVYPISSSQLDPDFSTGFYSQCPGEAGDNWIRLGVDFFDACAGGVVCSDVKGTTWGKIKRQYR